MPEPTEAASVGCVKCGADDLPLVGHEPCPGPTADPETLGAYLRTCRVSLYRTQRTIASVLRVPLARWSRIEADREKPPRELLPDLAALLGADLDRLLALWETWTQAPPPDLAGGPCPGRST